MLVCDPVTERLQKLLQSVIQCGAIALPCEDLSTLEESGRVVLASLGSTKELIDERLALIRTLKTRGLRVICYEDDCRLWSLCKRCLPLAAGAVELLDSAAAGFSSDMQAVLRRLLIEEAESESERKALRDAMASVGMVGKSAAILGVFRTVVRVSRLSDLPVLITGETGTGKEQLARSLHRLDPKRGTGPFVAINCGAVSATLAESELFGHRRGAFTGADRDRKGLIRAADGGVLFLDEIGELETALQAKLLRVLQDGRVLGVGEEKEVGVSVRVLAATNRDLKEMVVNGRFRADLFHRLHALPIHVPPLRERLDDVAPLVDHFLQKHRALHPHCRVVAGIDFIEALRQLELAGNAREVENIVRQALVHCNGAETLRLSCFPAELLAKLSERTAGTDNLQPGSLSEPMTSGSGTDREVLVNCMASLLDRNGGALSLSIKECERLLLEATLRRTCGNQSRAARQLGITPRSVFNKLRKMRTR